jgi:hypothetical protein
MHPLILPYPDPPFCLQSPLQSLHRRPRNSITVQVVVDVNQHTRISPLIESSRASTTRSLRPTPTNHQINTLRVVLRPIVAPGSMQRHNLMPQHISTSLETRRNRHSPRVVVGDKVIRSPGARRRTALQADLIDFGEFERDLVDGRAVVVRAGGEVVENGALMSRRPGVPKELHGLAGDDGNVGFAGFARFVADYVAGLVAIGRDLKEWGWLGSEREKRGEC